jgi:hypothetical protein
MYTLNVYEWPYYMCIQRLLLGSNGFNIMVTLSIYFEFIKVPCKIFIKYITTILQVYPNYLVIFLETITNEIYYHYSYVIIFIIYIILY